MLLDALLEIRHASKSFDGVRVLRGVDLSVARGEVHALMGENGAGKSTLIKVLAGVLSADSLSLQAHGAPGTIRRPQDAHRLGFRFIHQELNLVSGLSVAENIFLGHPYPKTRLGTVNWAELAHRARETLERLGITHIAVQKTAGRLSVGDAMLVSVARAFVEDTVVEDITVENTVVENTTALGALGPTARLYVMDEPTAALSRAETELLFTVIRGLKARGSSVLYVSHRMEEIFEISDRITVMRDGQVVATTPVRDAAPADLIRQMTGRPLTDAYPARTLIPSKVPILEVKGAATAHLKGVSLTLYGGEIVGVSGLAGSGRSELLRGLAGVDPLKAEVLLGGNRVDISSPVKAWRHGVAFVPEERRTQGLIMSASVRANTVLPHLGRLSRLGFADRRRERALSQRLAKSVRLRAQGLDQPVHSLSGGNQQKVMLARALAARPKVLLLDEPTRGVDMGAKHDIYALILEAAADGAAVLMVSSDLPELLGLCSRILVMQAGRLIHEVPARGLGQAALLALCYPEKAA